MTFITREDYETFARMWWNRTRIHPCKLGHSLPENDRATLMLLQDAKPNHSVPVSYNMILALNKVYATIPDWSAPAMLSDQQTPSDIDYVMSPEVAVRQIQQARKSRHIGDKRLRQAMLDHHMPPHIINMVFHAENTAPVRSVSRHNVAALLCDLGYQKGMGASHAVAADILPLPHSLIDIAPLCHELSQIFDRVCKSYKDAYAVLPAHLKKNLPFNEVAGWFEGKVSWVSKEHVGLFLSATLVMLENEGPA